MLSQSSPSFTSILDQCNPCKTYINKLAVKSIVEVRNYSNSADGDSAMPSNILEEDVVKEPYLLRKLSVTSRVPGETLLKLPQDSALLNLSLGSSDIEKRRMSRPPVWNPKSLFIDG